MQAGEPARRSFETSAFDGASFTVNLPWTAAYGPRGKRRDFGRVEGLLDYVCDVANALRLSVGLPEMEAWGRELSELLQAVVERRLENPSDDLIADIGARFEGGVNWARRLERVRGGVAFRYDANVTSSDGFYALLAVLLMHPKYQKLVRKCPECDNFFVRTGKRKFCGRDCATKANDADVLKRQARQRRRRAAEKLLSHVASQTKRADAVRRALKDHPDVTAEELAAHAKALLQAPRKHR